MSDRSESSKNVRSDRAKRNSNKLKSIVVTIRRHTIPEAESTSIQRNLEDPTNLVIHRKGKQRHMKQCGIQNSSVKLISTNFCRLCAWLNRPPSFPTKAKKTENAPKLQI